MEQTLFYDRIVRVYRRNAELQEQEKAGRERLEERLQIIPILKKKNTPKDLAEASTFEKEVKDLEKILKFLEGSRRDNQALADRISAARVFVINGAIMDDLANIPYNASNFDQLDHMPFPRIFFETMDGLEFKVDSEQTRILRGVLFENLSEISKGKFSVKIYYEDSVDEKGMAPLKCDLVQFNKPDLPCFVFTSAARQYLFSESGVKIIDDLKKHFEESKELPEYFDKVAKDILDKTTPGDKDLLAENMARVLNICTNLITYINAHNITIVKHDRTSKDIEAINRKRLRKGKSPLDILKPFYWIDIKQSTSHEDDSRKEAESQMEYREWVRGHFHRYHMNDPASADPKAKTIVTKWIQPYVRGPENKPWKKVRYRVLDDMLRKGGNPFLNNPNQDSKE